MQYSYKKMICLVEGMGGSWSTQPDGSLELKGTSHCCIDLSITGLYVGDFWVPPPFPSSNCWGVLTLHPRPPPLMQLHVEQDPRQKQEMEFGVQVWSGGNLEVSEIFILGDKLLSVLQFFSQLHRPSHAVFYNILIVLDR